MKEAISDVLIDSHGSTSFSNFNKYEHYNSIIGDVEKPATKPSFHAHGANLQSSCIMAKYIPVVTDDVIPLMVPAAGGLPCTAIMLAFGNDFYANKMRAERIVIELASQKNHYFKSV